MDAILDFNAAKRAKMETQGTEEKFCFKQISILVDIIVHNFFR